MAWLYQQIGCLFTPQGAPSAHRWYSGHDQGLNNPSAEDLRGVGPLPAGQYTLSEFIDHRTSMGPVAIRLTPDAATRARIINMGRDPDSLFAHDGNVEGTMTASEGCLVCLQGTVGVESLWDSSDHQLKVESGLDLEAA